MKEVKIVTLDSTIHFARTTFDNIDEIVEDMYKKGYEYKGSVVSREVGYGAANQVKLIFDREY